MTRPTVKIIYAPNVRSSFCNTFISHTTLLILVILQASVLYSREKTTTLMYKSIICFFSFPFITRKVRLGRVRESRRWLKYTHIEATVRFFCETSLAFCFVLLSRDSYRATSRNWILLVSPRFSTFVSLTLGYLKDSNHLSFSLFLYFHESRTGQAFLYLSTLANLVQGQNPEQRNVLWMTSCPEAMGWDSWVFWKKQLVEIWT